MGVSGREPSFESLPSTARVEAFSDGVIGFVATLLVLDLHVPHIPDDATFVQTLQSLRPISFKLVTFALSFFFVVIVWVNHHQVFHSLQNADRKLLWLNNFLLFWLCCFRFRLRFLANIRRCQSLR